MSMQTLPPVTREAIDYPEYDGQPLAQCATQYFWITYINDNFEYFYRDRPDVFVAGDLFWYPVEGNNTLRTAPDTMIVFGAPKGRRSSYLQWLEGKVAPQVVWEVLPRRNRPEEMREKLEFYEQYGVEEYYQYDPDGIELHGWLREGDRLQAIPAIDGWVSPRTGVRMTLENEDLVLTKPDGKRFIHYDETRVIEEEKRQAREAAEARANYALSESTPTLADNPLTDPCTSA